METIIIKFFLYFYFFLAAAGFLVQGYINFSVPVYLYICALQRYATPPNTEISSLLLHSDNTGNMPRGCSPAEERYVEALPHGWS